MPDRTASSADRLLDARAAFVVAPRSVPRELLDRPGDWPDGTTTDPHAARAQQLARNLANAMGSMTVRDLSEASGVSIGTISNVTRGRTWPDALAVMRLEQALGTALWPAWKDQRRR